MSKETVLFICIHNSARSQMAEEFLRKIAGDRFEVESAGLEPGAINPYVVKVMAEEGVDLSGKKTKSVMDLYRSGKSFHYVITVCDRKTEEQCPTFPGTHERLLWPFPDPSAFEGSEEEILCRTREVRDAIRTKIAEFADVISTLKNS